MAKLVYALNVSLDGYVDHDAFAPDPVLFRHFIDDVSSVSGSVYGRRMYEIMRYWDDERPEWSEAERDYAIAWRRMPKWVVSRSRIAVGPNATLLHEDLETAIRDLKTRFQGDIEVAGPNLAGNLAKLGLVDEFRMYVHPVVIGSGRTFFSGPLPPLHLVGSERIGQDVIRLTYVPAERPSAS